MTDAQKSRLEAYRTAWATRAMTLNEIRALEDKELPPDDSQPGGTK